MLLNPDTELRPGAVQCLVAELQRRPDAGIVGPKLLNTDGSLQTSCVQALPTPWNQALDSELLRRLFPNSRLWGVGEAFRSSSPVGVEAVSGACMLILSEVFRRVGGFSPEFFMYGEDMDLCAKVRKLGFTVYHVPAATVLHHGGGSSRAHSNQFSVVQTRVAGETYMRLNHGSATAFEYGAFQAVSALVRLVLLFPACLLVGDGRRAGTRLSLKKWCYVLQWAFGMSAIRRPPRADKLAQWDILDTKSLLKPVSRRGDRRKRSPARRGRPAIP